MKKTTLNFMALMMVLSTFGIARQSVSAETTSYQDFLAICDAVGGTTVDQSTDSEGRIFARCEKDGQLVGTYADGVSDFSYLAEHSLGEFEYIDGKVVIAGQTVDPNWCNEGHPWAGTCKTEWEWVAGWYQGAYHLGVISSIPAEYGGNMTTSQAQAVVSPTAASASSAPTGTISCTLGTSSTPAQGVTVRWSANNVQAVDISATNGTDTQQKTNANPNGSWEIPNLQGTTFTVAMYNSETGQLLYSATCGDPLPPVELPSGTVSCILGTSSTTPPQGVSIRWSTVSVSLVDIKVSNSNGLLRWDRGQNANGSLEIPNLNSPYFYIELWETGTTHRLNTTECGTPPTPTGTISCTQGTSTSTAPQGVTVRWSANNVQAVDVWVSNLGDPMVTLLGKNRNGSQEIPNLNGSQSGFNVFLYQAGTTSLISSASC